MTLHPYVLSQTDFVQGEQLTYPFQERGLQFGDGIYEVIRVYKGEYYLLQEHIDRLYRSAAAIRIRMPMQREELAEKLNQLVKKNDITKDAKVYLQVTRGSAIRNHAFPETPPNLYAYVQSFPRPLENIHYGVSAITRPDERWQTCYIKSLNLLPNVLAKQEAEEKGCYEAIFHRDGIVTECSTSNVYLVKDRTIFTHPETKQILHGCVRLRLKQLLPSLPVTLTEKAFTIEEFAEAEEVFLTSSVAEITPIIKIDNQPVGNGQPGTITRQLQRLYEEDASLSDQEMWKTE